MPCNRLYMLALLFSMTSLSEAQAQNWSYDGDQNNQDEWATLDKAYAACGNGTRQSPVQIGITQKEHLPMLVFHYGDTKALVRQKEYTLRADIGGYLTLVENDKTYRLTQLRLHTPSEHMVLGRFWPVEIQLIHKDESGKMLIVAVFAEAGASNAGMQSLLDHLPDKTSSSDISFNPQAFIPPKPGHYAYTGSLTIPPCTEGIEWRVLKQPVTVSQSQIMALEKITGRNSRLPQPIYVRTILETSE